MKTQKTLYGYRLGEIIHTGNMSQVWKAMSPGGETVALKVVLDKSKNTQGLASELRQEARVLRGLDHENVIDLIDFRDGGDGPAIVLEYFPGKNLAVLCKDDRELVKRHMARVLVQICLAMEHVHRRGYIHRDMKPGNVLMSGSGQIKLIDFALARKIRWWCFGMGIRDRSISGTRSFVAPETLDRKRYDQRADIYSLGITMYFLLAGRLPFTGSSARELAAKHLTASPTRLSSHDKHISREANDLVLRMLAKDPAERPASAGEVLHKIQSMELYR